MLNHLVQINRVVLGLLFPPKCITCNREGSFICSSCALTINRIKPPVCPVCVLPLSGRNYCDCRYWQSLDGLTSPFVFRGVIREAILQMKYHNLRAVAPLLAGMMYNHLVTRTVKPDLLVAVPLHRKRLWNRGYNQSELLTRELSRLAGIAISRCLVKTRDTGSQVKSGNTRARRRNVNRAFGWKGAALHDRNVLLVDDVATTGATLDACANTLKSAGARQVWALTLAREV